MSTPDSSSALTHLSLSLCHGSHYHGVGWNPLELPLQNLRFYDSGEGMDLSLWDDDDDLLWDGEEPPLHQQLMIWKREGREDKLKSLPRVALDTLVVRGSDMQNIWSLLGTHPQLNSQLTRLELYREALPDDPLAQAEAALPALPSLCQLLVEVSYYGDLLKLQVLTQLKSLVIRVPSDEQDIAVGNSSIAFCSCFVNLERLEYIAGSYGSHYLDDQALQALAEALPQLKSFSFAGHIASHELTCLPGEPGGSRKIQHVVFPLQMCIGHTFLPRSADGWHMLLLCNRS